MTYLTDFHWIWYGFGFLLAPRLTIMIMLSIHFNNFIPKFLMFFGWFIAFSDFISIKSGDKSG